jgi:hypothetical protein
MRLSRLVPAALAVAAMAGAAACGESSTAFPGSIDSPIPQAALGAYTLQSINTRPLPAETRRDATGSSSVTAGQLTLGAGTFFQSLTIADSTADGQTRVHTSGTQGMFSVSGGEIHFRASDGGTWDGTWTGTKIDYSITGNSGPVTFSFQRS